MFWFRGKLLIGNRSISTTSLCIDNQTIADCGSSIRYKENVQDLTSGLEKVMQLRPVTYDWIETGKADLGFIAEETDLILPELTEFNALRQVNGFNYRHFTAVLTLAIQEQQALIEAIQNEINSANGITPTGLITIEEAIISNKLEVYGLVDFGDNTVGETLILAGETEVEINFSESYSTPPFITVTPEGEEFINSGLTYAVIEKTVDSFKIKISGTYTEDLTFNWHAFE